jgi:GNAT superfamily N-acetyltransferase
MNSPRTAGRFDIPEIVRVINAAYRVEDFFVNGNRTSDTDIAARMATPGVSFLVLDDEIPGRLAAAVSVDVLDGRGHFAMLSVDPDHQGKGLARSLMSAIEDHCRSAGCTELDIEVVNLREELPAFYTAFGYTPSGTAPFTPPEKLTRPAHLVRMTKKLTTETTETTERTQLLNAHQQ